MTGKAMTAAQTPALTRPKPRASVARQFDRLGAVLGCLALSVWAAVMLLDPAGDTPGERAGGGGAASQPTELALGPETVVSGYFGVPYTHPSDIRFVMPGNTDLTVHDVAWFGRPFKSPIYYGLRATRWNNASAFGTMLDFTHSKAIAPAGQQARMTGTRNGQLVPETGRIGDMFKHLEFSHGHNMLTLNKLMRLSAPAAKLSPYIGAGIGVNLPHTEVGFLNEPHRTYEYQYTGPIGQVLTGFEIRLPRVTLYVEYKLSLSYYEAPLTGRDNKASFGYTDFLVQLMSWWRGEKPRYGVATTTLLSHQVIGGLGPRFVSAPAAR